MTITTETENELINQSDRNVFEFWTDEIVALYATGRNHPNWGVIRRALHRSNLVNLVNSRYIWSDEGISLIEGELKRRGLVIKRHRSLFRKEASIARTEARSSFKR
jgi:hypothetical protein